MPAPSSVSTALSIEVTVVPDFVYFQQHIDKDWIRIGFTAGNGRREDRQNDYEPVAVILAGHADEKALHTFFEPFRVAQRIDRGVFGGEQVWDYVNWLLERNHAGRDRSEAERMPRLPWKVWSPEVQRNEGRDGEQQLFAALPVRERIAHTRSDLAHLSSESDDWYTPADIVDAARDAMGGIDLDPATCVSAQRKVRAERWYTKDQDGLRTDLPWEGNVWLNPPYGRGESSASAFVQRLLREMGAGNVTQAITCLNLASASALWFDQIHATAAAHLIYRGRPNFWNDQHPTSSPTKGSILSYFGSRSADFAAAFGGMGALYKRIEATDGE